MFSITVPVPGRVHELADRLHPELTGFQTVREDRSCLLKRLGEADHAAQLRHRAHRVLEGAAPVEAAVTGIDYFADPPLGAAPVVYLAVESPGLEAIHADLVDAFGAVAGLEREAYVPHVTLARGGDEATAARVADQEVEPIRWTVSTLEFRDAADERPSSRIRLSG